MKKSKENEHRISNLKDMLSNIQDQEDINESIDEVNEVFSVEDTTEYEEDEELLEYLHGTELKSGKYEIDDEFIYHPDKSENNTARNLEANEINKDFIINTKLNDSEFSEDNNEYDNYYEEESPLGIDSEISKNFDNMVNAKVGKIPVIGIVSLVVGTLAIISALLMITSASDRVVDSVTSGEHNSILAVLLITGILLIICGIYKVTGFKQLEKLTDSIKNIEKEPIKKQSTENESDTEDSTPQIDKDTYKTAELNIEKFKSNIKKSNPDFNKKTKQTTLDNIPLAQRKLTEKEIEEIEYRKARLDTESIDDIFADVEDINKIPIVSVDSKEDKNKKE